MRASQPTARTSVMAMTPSGVTSASGRPGAATVRPLALTKPCCTNVAGAGCTQLVASRDRVLRRGDVERRRGLELVDRAPGREQQAQAMVLGGVVDAHTQVDALHAAARDALPSR